jgi:hypothetical protein
LSRVSHFQRFSQPENHATNNTLLLLRYFYQSSPFKIQSVLTSLLETDLSIGLAFEQQIRGMPAFRTLSLLRSRCAYISKRSAAAS